MGRKSGKSGKLYSVERGTLLETGDLTTDTWYQIAAIGAATALPISRVLGVFRAASAITLAAGDTVYPLTVTMCGFARDVKRAASRPKYDLTTQVDKIATYDVDEITERTGTIDGILDTTDPQVAKIMAEFDTTIEYAMDGSGTEIEGYTDNILRFLLSRDETGDPELWQYMPMVVDSLNDDKPMRDAQAISFNYTLVGTELPQTLWIKKS